LQSQSHKRTGINSGVKQYFCTSCGGVMSNFNKPEILERKGGLVSESTIQQAKQSEGVRFC